MHWEASDLSSVIPFLSTGLRIDCEGVFSCRRRREAVYRKPTGLKETRGHGDLDQDCGREGCTA